MKQRHIGVKIFLDVIAFWKEDLTAVIVTARTMANHITSPVKKISSKC